MVDTLTLPTPTPVGDEWGAILNAGIRAVNDDVEAIQAAMAANQTAVNDALALKVSTTRTVSPGTGLTGGGDLSADRTLAVDFAASGATSATKAVRADDSRLSDARTPLGHTHTKSQITDFAHTHATSEVTGLDTALTGKVGTGRQVIAGSGLTGGGDLTADRTLAVTWATATPLGLALAGAVGTAVKAAREDHVHPAPAWTAYTPTWTAATTNPSLGNGTLTGKYVQTGKTVVGRIYFKAGSTTTFGAGQFLFSVPVPMLGGTTHVGTGLALDVGTRYWPVAMVVAGASTFSILTFDGQQNVQSNAPYVFTNGDEMHLTFTYEAA